MRFRALTILSLVAAACSERDAAPRESAPAKIGACWGRPTIGEGGVGTVRVGQTIAQLARTCVTRDTMFSRYWLEGAQAETAKVVRYGGHELVALTPGRDRPGQISNIVIHDPAFRTAAGAGVGSTIADLRKAYGSICSLTDEDTFGVRVRGLPGVSFGVRTASDTAPPDSGRVAVVWIYGPEFDAGSECQ